MLFFEVEIIRLSYSHAPLKILFDLSATEMSTSSAADWCRAVLQEVTPSPINNIPLPIESQIPPPPPPAYADAVKQSKAVARPAAAVAVAQPSAQYQAYYNQYYQQAYASPVAAATTT